VKASDDADAIRDAARAALIEAESEYQRTRYDDYVARIIRDASIVKAHRAGIPQKEISKLVGDMGQPNVARVQRREQQRTFTRRDVVAGGMLAPDDALERSGLGPADFMRAVRDGRLQPKSTGYTGVWAFLPEDVDACRFSGHGA
jgi:hypothetical protein